MRLTVVPTRAAAFSPGHVTGIFEIHDEADDPLRRGSRGAGFSLSSGATSVVEIAPADSMTIETIVNREPSDAPITREAVTTVLKEAVQDLKIPLNRDAPKGQRARIAVRVTTELALPESQGFGMSAAGALSAALATAKTLRIGRSTAVRAAHVADVTHRGGLGDVVGASIGGFEIRTAPGVPPYGNVTNFVGYGDAVVCIIGGKLPTRDILSDHEKRAAVNAAGARGLERLLKEPTMEAFLEESQRFARDARLMPEALERAAQACRPHGRASMSMLGNSLFAFGDAARLEDVLGSHGEVRRIAIDPHGARLLEIA